MSKNKAPFHDLINMLVDDASALTETQLTQFSDIAPPELSALLEAWPRIALKHKDDFLARLRHLAAENTLLSYDALARALLTDTDANVRAQAIRLLDECDDASLIPSFLELLRHDTLERVRAEAATALGLFVLQGEMDEIDAESQREIEEALLTAARDVSQPEVQRRAIESLGYSSRSEVPALLESAYWREDRLWTASAVFAMGRSSDARWQKEILASLLHDNPQIRLAAARSAGELELEAARPSLLTMLEEEDDEDIFNAAVWSLSQIGGEDVRTYLESLIDKFADDEGEMLDFLEDALANLSFTDDFQQLDMLAFDPDDPILQDD